MTNNYDIEIQGKRLSPRSMLYKISRQLPYLALYAYFGIYQNSGTNWIFLILALIGGLFVVPATLLSYFYFKYLITPDELIIQSGVVNRKQRNIPLRRIQNININQNFLQRLLGISTVKMETAGDATSEAMLDSVSKDNANEIREIIKNYQAEIEGQEDKSKNFLDEENQSTENKSEYDLELDQTEKKEKSESNVKELIQMSFWDVFKFGQLRFRPILLIAFGWFMSLFQQFQPEEFSHIDEYINQGLDSYLGGFDYYAMIIYIVFAVIIALILSWIADIILTVIQFYGFRLSIEGNKLYTNYGLLAKKQGTIPLKKLQMMIIHTNAIRKRFGYWGLNIETAGTAGRQGKAPETVVPFAKWSRVIDLAQGIRKFLLPEEFIQVSRKTIRRAFIRLTWVLIIATLILTQIIDSWWITAGFLPLIFLLSIWRWQSRGYYFEGDNLIVKQGWFFKKIKVISVSKIQNIIVSSNVFQRNMGLASVHIDTAASSGFNDLSIIDIETEKAIELSKELSLKFHNLNKES